MTALPARTVEPTVIVTGEKVEWTRSFDDYPASLWTLTYLFRGPGTGIDILATANGDDFVISIPTTTSDNFILAGRYKYQAWVAKIADVTDTHMVREGYVRVEIAFIAGTPLAVEIRSAAKVMLDSIDAAFTAFATSDVLEYEISTPAGSRRVKRSDKTQLMSMRKYWLCIVARENAMERVRNGGPFAKSVVARLYDD